MSFIEIIEEVRSKPQLWNSSYPKRIRNTLWGETAKRLNIDEIKLKKKWKHLKDQYRKEIKKELHSSDSDKQRLSTWKYYQQMEFLRNEIVRSKPDNNSEYPPHSYEYIPLYVSTNDCIDEMKSEENESEYIIDHPVNSLEIGIDEMSQSSPNIKAINNSHVELYALEQKKLKLLYEMSQFEGDSDPDLMFFMSVLPIIRQLNDFQKLRFRTDLNNVLMRIMKENRIDI